jgi:membrane dipeptidase
VADTPALLVELLRRGWNPDEVAGVAGDNVLRALQQAEEAAAGLRAEREPSVERITPVMPDDHEH